MVDFFRATVGGQDQYTPRNDAAIETLARKGKMKMVVEPEVITIKANNTGRNDYEVANLRLMRCGDSYIKFDRYCFHGPYAEDLPRPPLLRPKSRKWVSSRMRM